MVCIYPYLLDETFKGKSLMKICLYNVTSTIHPVGTSEVGGTEAFSFRLGTALVKRGHKVVLVGGGRRKEGANNGLEVITFPYIETSSIPDFGSRFKKFIQRIHFFLKAKDYIKNQRFNIINIFKPYDFLPAFFFKRWTGARVIARFGGAEFYFLDTFFSRYIDTIYSNSKYTAELVKKRYGIPVSVIPNGIDTEVFRRVNVSADIKNGFGIKEGEVVLLYVGRLVGWKGIDRLILAFKHLVKTIPLPLRLVIAGDGVEMKKLIDMAKGLGISQGVSFLGRVESYRLPYLYSSADIYIQPSIGADSSPHSLIEAMSCSLPAIGTRSGGIPEIIKDYETGFLVEAGDTEGLFRRLSILVKDDNLRVEMGRRARSLVERGYSLDIMVDRLLTIMGDGNE